MVAVRSAYNYTGSAVSFTVPTGVTEIRFELWGASGGGSTSPGTPPHFTDAYYSTAAAAQASSKGYGTNGAGYVAGTLPVTEGDAFGIYVGQNGKNADGDFGGGISSGLATSVAGGAGGWNGGGAGGAAYHPSGGPLVGAGGGGGGATDIRRDGTGLADRILVAGGAAGAGGRQVAHSYTATANPSSPVPPYSPATYYISAGSAMGGYGGTTGHVGGGGTSANAGGGGGTGAGGTAGSAVGSGQAGSAGAYGVGGAGGASNSTRAAAGWTDGGGGGGGGYYGGGGGANGAGIGAGGGGGSNYVDEFSFTDTGSNENQSHAFPPSTVPGASGIGSTVASGYGGFAVLAYQQPPNPPSFAAPEDGGIVTDTGDTDVSLNFSSLVSGTVFSTFDIRWRTSPSGINTTVSGIAVSGSTGSYTIPAGEFTGGIDYDIEARVTDSEGDTSDWSTITVSAVSPPDTPFIIDPSTTLIDASPFDVTWSQTSGDTQGAYEVLFVDSDGGVVYTSGIVTSATQSHTVNWTAGGQTGMTLKVRYSTATAPDIFSMFATQDADVNIDPPGVPTVTVEIDEEHGWAVFTFVPDDTVNETATFDVYRQDLTHGTPEIRVATGIVPDGPSTTPPTTTILRPVGAVTITDHLPNLSPTGGSEAAGVGVFGASPQWSDDSDSTYARVRSAVGTGVDYAVAALNDLSTVDPADITSATLSIRVSGPSDTTSDTNFRIGRTGAEYDTGLVGDADPADLGPLPAANVPTTFSGVPLDFSDPIADVLVQEGLAVYVWPTPNTSDIEVYEVAITVEIAGEPIPRQAVWTDYTCANRTQYRYRVRANSAAGGFTFD